MSETHVQAFVLLLFPERLEEGTSVFPGHAVDDLFEIVRHPVVDVLVHDDGEDQPRGVDEGDVLDHVAQTAGNQHIVVAGGRVDDALLHTHEHVGHGDVHDRGPEGAQLVGDLIVPEHIDLLALEIGEAGDGLLAADEHTDGQGVGEQDLDPIQLLLDFGEGVLHFQYPRRGIFKGHARTDQGEDPLVEGELPHGHVIAEFGHVRDAVLDGFESVGFLAEGFREIGFDADTPAAALVQLFGPLLEGEVPAVMDRRDGQVEAQDVLFSRVINGMKTSGKKRDNLGSIGKSFRRGCNSIAESATKKEGNQPSFFVGG